MSLVAILRIAAWLVPAAQRAEWLAEWTAELWYVRTSKAFPTPIPFVLGSFCDALWLRQNTPHGTLRAMFRLQSPWHCGLFLATVAAFSLFFTLRIPAAYTDARLVMISAAGSRDATLTFERYRTLSTHPSNFRDLAFYRIAPAQMQTARHRTVALSVAVASSNLFELLNIPISSSTEESLILSNTVWRKHFDSDPKIIGRVFKVAGRPVRIGGILAENSWHFPGTMDAWLLAGPRSLADFPSQAKGFALGNFRPAGPHTPPDGLDCKPLTGVMERPLARLLLVAGFACLLVPVTTTISLGDYPSGLNSPPLSIRLRRWIFLCMKIVCILLVLYCGMLWMGFSQHPPVHGFLLGCILAFRWALIDQPERCPVCLRLLASPAQIGYASQTFLGWYGTEFACSKGHGLLHVPEIQSSTAGPQRWLYLDRSWSGLFPSGDY